MGIKQLSPISYPRAILLAIFIGIVAFALGFNTTSMFDMIPRMARELHLNSVAVQWLLSSYMLTATVFILAGGKLGDYLRKKWIFGAGSLLFVASSLLVGFSFDDIALFVGRILQGLALAFVLPVTITIMKVTIPERMQVTAFGIWSAILGLGLASGPTIGGSITLLVSWRVVFFVAAGFILIGLIPAWFLIPRYKENLKPFHFDWLGILFFVVGFGLLIIGLMQGEAWGWTDIKTLLFIIAGVVLFIIFFIVEAFIRGPLLLLSDFSNRQLMAAVIGNLAYGFTITTTLSYILGYLQNPLLIAKNALTAGVDILPFSIAIFILSISMDLIHKVFSNVRAFLGIGFLLIAISFFVLFFVNMQSGYWFFFVPVIIAGIGVAFLQSNLPKASADAVVPEQVGEATGLNWTAFYIGSIFSVILLSNISHDVFYHVFIDRLQHSNISRDQGINIINMLDSGKHTIDYILSHIQSSSASSSVTSAYRTASVITMKVIMMVAAAIVAIIGLISTLMAGKKV